MPAQVCKRCEHLKGNDFSLVNRCTMSGPVSGLVPLGVCLPATAGRQVGWGAELLC